MSIKLITFDLDNTLWHTDPVIIKADQVQWQSILSRCPEVESLFTQEKFKQLKLDVAQQNPHLRHKLSFLRREVLFQLFLQCGLNQTQAKLFSQQVFSDFLQARNQVELFPGALTLLQELQSNYQLIALSNGNADLTKIGLDSLFTAHFHAENVSRPKPYNDMFLAALEHSNASPEESLHIGDNPKEDIEAAKKIGLKTVWANLLQQPWPNHITKADYDITHLNQLKTLLKY